LESSRDLGEKAAHDIALARAEVKQNEHWADRAATKLRRMNSDASLKQIHDMMRHLGASKHAANHGDVEISHSVKNYGNIGESATLVDATDGHSEDFGNVASQAEKRVDQWYQAFHRKHEAEIQADKITQQDDEAIAAASSVDGGDRDLGESLGGQSATPDVFYLEDKKERALLDDLRPRKG